MPQEPPNSRPDTPDRPPAAGRPQRKRSVYGDQWGSSGKQSQPSEKGQPDRPSPIQPPREAE